MLPHISPYIASIWWKSTHFILILWSRVYVCVCARLRDGNKINHSITWYRARILTRTEFPNKITRITIFLLIFNIDDGLSCVCVFVIQSGSCRLFWILSLLWQVCVCVCVCLHVHNIFVACVRSEFSELCSLPSSSSSIWSGVSSSSSLLFSLSIRVCVFCVRVPQSLRMIGLHFYTCNGNNSRQLEHIRVYAYLFVKAFSYRIVLWFPWWVWVSECVWLNCPLCILRLLFTDSK